MLFRSVTYASVIVTAGTISSMCIERFPAVLPQGLWRYRYVQEYSTISTTGTGWKANIDWYYTDSEAMAGGVTRPDMLRCVRQVVNAGAWQDPTAGVVSTPFAASNFVRGAGYTDANVAGNHCLVTDYFTPKMSPISTVAPNAFDLEQNYPNPFNPTTNINFSVAEESHVSIVVYNSLGSEVTRLVDEVLPAGQYTTPFDATNLTSGSYFYKMTAGSFTNVKQMLLSK